jgi:DNA-binding SARP family transcriptional activator
MMVLRVLGPLEAEIDGQVIDLGSRLQRAVLALLLTERGHAVSVDRMIDQLWQGEAPPRAIASLQSYISNLRRLLEPRRPQRSPSTILISAPPGYAIRLPAEAVDAWEFERCLGAARDAADHDPQAARQSLEEGLALFRGEAYAEFADEEWASPEARRLAELRAQARELWAQVALRTGPPAQVVPAASELTREYPLREEGWRLLALAQWGAGRQGDALGALRQARQVLGDELGIDPGPALTDLEEAILRQHLDVLHSALGARVGLPNGADSGPVNPDDDGKRGASGESSVDSAKEQFVGRKDELGALRTAAAAAARGPGGVVLITGEAGLGKSALLARARDQLTAGGWLAVTGSCPETEGAPPAWAWVQVLRELAGHLPAEQVSATVAAEIGDYSRLARYPGTRTWPVPDEEQEAAVGDTAAGRFRLHRAVVTWLRAAAARQPIAVFLDDLHNADAETSALLESLAAELAGSPVLLAAAYRPADADGRLDDVLAALARRTPLRLNLPGLPPPDVAALVQLDYDGPVDEQTLNALAERTGGNPFYIRETARLLASEGALAVAEEVPEGVRDVLRKRLARLPARAVTVLRLAAVAGREADVDVLVAAADADEDAVLDGLEAGVFSGLLTEPSPGRVRFEHVLVRDTLYGDLTRLRRVRMHSRFAEALRALRPGDLDALAYHYGQAMSPGTAPLVVEYAIKAADLAKRRYAHDAEVALLRQALDAFGLMAAHGSDADLTGQEVDLLGRLLAAQVRAGRIPDARQTRQHAVAVAERAGRPDLAAAAFAAWTEPTPWQARSVGEVDLAAISSLTRLLDGPGLLDGTTLPSATRCRLLAALVDELAGEDDPRPAEAAAESLRIARELAAPDLIALALAASIKAARPEQGAQARLRYTAELARIAEAHAMPAYAWYAEYFNASVLATQGEVAAQRAALGRLQVIAQRYRMTEPQAVNGFFEAFLAHVEGRFADAEADYARATALMARNDPQYAIGIHLLGLLTVRISEGRAGELLDVLRDAYAQFGPIAVDPYAAVLVAAGRLDEVPAVRASLPPLRPDFLYTLYATFRAMAVVGLGATSEAETLLAALMPMRDQLAGANTTALVMRPVAHTLGDLCQLLGRHEEAERHFAHAEAVALRWGAGHWAAAARSALAAVPR